MQKLLFTGASGFLGTNVRPILDRKYEIKTVGLSESDDYNVNMSNVIPELKEHYDVVLHAAGKAHIVPRTEEEKKSFFDVNYQGTVNLCKALEKIGVPKSLIFISTVAVYGLDNGENITEEAELAGNTPYAESKIKAEKFLIDWCKKNNVILTVLRPSLLAGPNAPGNLGAMAKGIRTGKYLSIAGGRARKSVLMVQDIANLVMLSADKGGIYNVCDDSQPTFRELERIISSQLGKKLPISIPFWTAKAMALVGDLLGNRAPINSLKLEKITKSNTYSNERAKKELGWKPLNVLENYNI